MLMRVYVQGFYVSLSHEHALRYVFILHRLTFHNHPSLLFVNKVSRLIFVCQRAHLCISTHLHIRVSVPLC